MSVRTAQRDLNDLEGMGVPLWDDERTVFMAPHLHDTPASEAFAQLRNSVRYAGTNEPEKLLEMAPDSPRAADAQGFLDYLKQGG